MSTFVSVGNATQPFPRLLNAVFEIAHRLPQPIVVQYGNTPLTNAKCVEIQFLEMEAFERLVGVAELLILHAGAGSVIQALRAGKVPVVMPRRAQSGEHIDDHQVEFARAMAEVGRVIVVEQAEELESAVGEALSRQSSRAIVSEPTSIVRLLAKTLAGYVSARE